MIGVEDFQKSELNVLRNFRTQDPGKGAIHSGRLKWPQEEQIGPQNDTEASATGLRGSFSQGRSLDFIFKELTTSHNKSKQFMSRDWSIFMNSSPVKVCTWFWLALGRQLDWKSYLPPSLSRDLTRPTAINLRRRCLYSNLLGPYQSDRQRNRCFGYTTH